MQVGFLLSFVPWNHAKQILPIVQASDSRVTESSIAKRLKEKYHAAVEAVELAEEKRVEIIEPFAYDKAITLTKSTVAYFLGPSANAYLTKWLPYYDCLPAKPTLAALLKALVEKAEKAVKWVKETWDKELLVDPQADEVSAENNSSAILAVTQGEKRFPFAVMLACQPLLTRYISARHSG